LAAQIAGGEGFDWYYASSADHAAQTRTPIIDTAHGEDWVFRSKDLRGWWSHLHYDRPDGVRAAAPTAWVPGMKPIRLTEFGCPAVDRGGNAPNLFQDPKSSEGSLPPFSTGARDDRMQRRALEAVLGHFGDPANNPFSPVYGGPMLEAADAWCWDARPWPVFPARADVWADAAAWRTGHWLNGRLHGETRDLIAEILRRGGLLEDEFEVGTPAGEVQGYVIDRPMRTRDALEPLLAGLGLVAAERGGRVAVIGDEPPGLTLMEEGMALPAQGGSRRTERELEARPGAARVRFIDGAAGYQTGSAVVRTDGGGGGIDLDLPAVCSSALAHSAAARAVEAGREERLTITLGPLESMQVEPGDAVLVEGDGRTWRVALFNGDETPSVRLEPASAIRTGEDGGVPTSGEPAAIPGAPFLRLLDLPPLMGAEADARPVVVVAADPWRPMRVFAGPDPASLTARGDVNEPATVGVLVEGLSRGVRHRWDEVSVLSIRIEGRAPESLSAAAVLAGGNAVAIETSLGWEILQFRAAELVGADVWRLSGLLRGQQGTEDATGAGANSGVLAVFLMAGLERVQSPPAERGLPLIWRAGPAGSPAGGAGVSEAVFTVSGLHGRPWSPAHLRHVIRSDGGVDLTWRARSRLDGDRWEGEPAASDPPRFRIRLLKAGATVRTFEVDGAMTTCSAASLGADFPDGLGDAEAGVAQWGDGYGWGAETRVRLS
jgi:hypothetical protein